MTLLGQKAHLPGPPLCQLISWRPPHHREKDWVHPAWEVPYHDPTGLHPPGRMWALWVFLASQVDECCQ